MFTVDFIPSGDACSGVRVHVCAGSYGSLAMFSNLQRMVKATDTCLIGGSGDYSDFQQVRTKYTHTHAHGDIHADASLEGKGGVGGVKLPLPFAVPHTSHMVVELSWGLPLVTLAAAFVPLVLC